MRWNRFRCAAHCAPGILAAALANLAAADNSFVNFETPHVSPIALSSDGTRLFMVNTPDNRLEIFSLDSGLPVWTTSVAVGLEPVSVRQRTATEVWVVNHLSDSISVIDLTTNRVVWNIPTEDEPTDVVFARGRAFVTISQRNQIWVYMANNFFAPARKIDIVGEDPRMLTVSPDGSKVYAAIFESGNLTTILEPNQVSDPTGPYGGMNPPPNDGMTFDPPFNPELPEAPRVSHIVRKDLNSGLWLDGNGADWTPFVTWDLPDHDIVVVDTYGLGVSYISGLMNLDMALTVTPNNRLLVVGTDATNEMRFEPKITGRFVHVLGASVNLANPADRQIYDLNPHLADEYANGIGTISPEERAESIADPRGVVWDAARNRAYISGMGSNNVVMVDASGARVGRVEVGEGPTGLALDAARSQLYVVNKFEGSISVINLNSDEEVARVAYFDPTPPEIRDGRKFQYDAHLTSGLGVTACAGCHVDSRTDTIAWDLGDPSGELKTFNQDCQTELGADCEDWHPMKGPMTTQTLQAILDTAPLHWRADREGLEAFNPAFVGLLGREQELTDEEMASYKAFIASIRYQPNPNRTFDDQLPQRLGGANPRNGEFLYRERLTDAPLTCNDCHVIEMGGTNMRLTPADAMGSEQSMKVPQLRMSYEKIGFSRNSPLATRGFGFVHDGVDVNLVDFLQRHVFVFPDGPRGEKMRRDIQAFVMCFPTGTHAGIGYQVTVDLTHVDIDDLHELTAFENMGDLGVVGVVMKGHIDGENRGGVYLGNHYFQLDRAADPLMTTEDLVLMAGPGQEITFMLVPAGTQYRIGVDRDEDGILDGDE